MNCCDASGQCTQAHDCPARKQPYPFTNITPVNEELDELENELATAAKQLLVTFAVIFCVAFGLGYLTGGYV